MAKQYPAVFVLIFIVAGIIIADSTNISSAIYLFFSIVLFLTGVLFYYRGNKFISIIIFLHCFLTLSAFGYSFRFKTFPPGHIIHFVDDNQEYTIYGTVDDWPLLKEHQTTVFIKVDSIGLKNKVRRSTGRLRICISMETTVIQYGDRIYFDAKLYSLKGGKNPTGYDYRRYLNLKGVYAVCYLTNYFNIKIDPPGIGNFYSVIETIRNYTLKTFKSTLEPAPAALASGFLIGETKEIPPDIYQLFRDTGTLHLLAVSGSNVGLVVLFFVFLLRASPYKRLTQTIILLIIIVLFSFLAYNQPSVVRAAIMASLVLLGKVLQRKINLNNIIAATALIILVVKPTELFDIGFQLSFATAWGLIYFVPKTTQILPRRLHHPIAWSISFFLIVSIIAQIVSLPMVAFYFQRLPLVSFVSNLLIVPLVSFIVIGEVVVLMVSLILPLAGVFLGSLLNPVINLNIYLLNLFGSESFNVILHHKLSGHLLIIYFVFLILLFKAISSKKIRRLAVLYIFLAANILLINSLIKGSEKPDLTVLSSPAGLIVSCRLSGDRVVLSDLTECDYVISEKVIRPYLLSSKAKKIEAVTLSNDYNSIQELLWLISSFDEISGYIPLKSKSMFLDICVERGLKPDSVPITFYSKSNIFRDLDSNQVILSEQFMIYFIDSNVIVLVSNQFDLSRLNDVLPETSSDVVLLKSLITESNIRELSAAENGKVSVIICNRITFGVSEYMKDNEAVSIRIPEIYQTSQVGAVNLFILDSQIILND